MSIEMRNIKWVRKWKKEIIDNAESIMYARHRDINNNLQEREVIKYNGKYYRIEAWNKRLTEFTEV